MWVVFTTATSGGRRRSNWAPTARYTWQRFRTDFDNQQERSVRSIKSECLAQIIPLGERHLRHAVKEYTEHYHVERNHQGLGNELIDDQRCTTNMSGDIKRRERMGGVLNYYRRAA